MPATLALTLGTPAAFGAFTPGIGKTYTAGTTANVISTAGDATLSVADPSANATGRLVNGTFSLPAPLQAKATSPLGAGGALAAVGGSSRPDVPADVQRPRRPTTRSRWRSRRPSVPTRRCAPAATARR